MRSHLFHLSNMKRIALDIHDYQLKLFGLAFSLYALFWSTRKLLITHEINADVLIRGIGFIALIIFATALLHYRDLIWRKEIKQLTVWTLVLWILLGLILIGIHLRLGRGPALDDLFFIIFTIFLADSYWDFRDVPGAHPEYE